MKMKKIVPVLAILSLLFVPMIVGVHQAEAATFLDSCTPKKTWQELEVPGADGGCVAGVETKNSVCCLMSQVYTIGTWIFVALLVVAAIMIIYAGFIFVTASGSEDKIKKAKGMLMYAVVGIIVALLAQGVIQLVETVLK